jgi:hypothetical protein
MFEDIFQHWCEPAAPGGNMCKGQEALEALYKERSDHPFAAVVLVWDRDTDTVYVARCYRVREATP